MKKLLVSFATLCAAGALALAACGTDDKKTTAATPVATTAPVATSVTFAQASPLLVKHCGSCHANGTSLGGYSVSTQADAAKKAATAAKRMVGDGSMMPQAGLIDSTEEGKTLISWFKAGAPN